MSDVPEVPKKPELDPGSKYYQRRILDGLKSLDDAAADLLVGFERNYRKVPEAYFVAHLLPILRKWIINNPQDLAEPGLWFNVADGLHNPILVTDTKGELLFKTPLLFVKIPDRNPMENHPRLDSVHQMVAVQGQMFDNSDQRAAYQMEQEIEDVLMPTPEQAAKTENLLLTIEIYYRYKLPLEEVVGRAAPEIKEALDKRSKVVSVVEAPQTSGIADDEEFIYDD
jgi:hypothetical protein